MEGKPDLGASWRNPAEILLQEHGFSVYNPASDEFDALEGTDFSSKDEWIATKHTDLEKYLAGMRAIIQYDLERIENSGAVIVLLEPGMGGGTIGEITHAAPVLGIPVIGVLGPGLTRENLSKNVGGWVLGCCQNIVDTMEEAVDIITKYKETLDYLSADTLLDILTSQGDDAGHWADWGNEDDDE